MGLIISRIYNFFFTYVKILLIWDCFIGSDLYVLRVPVDVSYLKQRAVNNAKEGQMYFVMSRRSLIPDIMVHGGLNWESSSKSTVSAHMLWIEFMSTPHDVVIKWKHFPRYWSFVRGIHRSPVNFPQKASDAELWCFLWSPPEWTVE